MKPYFDTNHIAGPLLLIVTMAWGAMEVSQFSQGLEASAGGRSRRWASTSPSPSWSAPTSP